MYNLFSLINEKCVLISLLWGVEVMYAMSDFGSLVYKKTAQLGKLVFLMGRLDFFVSRNVPSTLWIIIFKQKIQI